MKLLAKSFCALTIVSLVFNTAIGQESLRSMQAHRPAAAPAQQLKSASPLELPFVADFSDMGAFLNPVKWTGGRGYINSQFGIDPPSMGVYTLDAMDLDGKIYDDASTEAFEADELISQSINLNIGGDTTCYFSFFYQGGGFGDAPEPQDSLILEFFAPSENKWVWIWSVAGQQMDQFEQVMIPVRGAIFLQSGFQFRFRNLASLADSYEPSLKANADHWHLDYLYLDKDRGYNDTAMNDMTLIKNTGSLLLNYQALPWEHFRVAGINEVKTIFPVHLKNLSENRKFYEAKFKISDDWGTSSGFEKNLTADEVQSFQELIYDATFNYGFTSSSSDSAQFSITLDLNATEDDLIPGNDQATFVQLFKNYYAHDDGSAELGYGITGEGANNAQIAVKFQNFVPGDSLVGVQMYFNRSIEDSNHKYFKIGIWSVSEGQPGDLLYIQEGFRNDPEMGINVFNYFALDTAQVVPDQYFVGIQQVTPDFLNIGFDRNTNSKDQIFYRTGMNWRNTSFEGSLMIRPVFANKSKKTNAEFWQTENSFDLKLFPNPVQDIMQLQYDQEMSSFPIRIINQGGQVVYEKDRLSPQISLRQLPAGTYHIIVLTTNGLISQKVIKL